MQATETLREQLSRINRELAAQGRQDSFYTSLEAAWNRYGSLTERQEAALVRSFAQRAERQAARAQENAAVTAPMPTGRVTISGEVIATKYQESRFGESLKMLVKSDAGWKVWGSVPQEFRFDGIKGCRVTFSATVEPKEASFGFFSRPTKACVLDHNAPAAPVAALAPTGKLSDIIAKAKELEERRFLEREEPADRAEAA